MSSDLLQKRKKIHQNVVVRMAEMVSTMTAFCLIFSVLLTLSNWPAYSRIIQDWIDPTVMAQNDSHTTPEPESADTRVEKPDLKNHPDAQKASSSFSLADLGELYPEEMRLEVPKVFSGSIPVKYVDVQHFDFKDLYSSENVIQNALREGVVHYPYTANPDQFGNVFITGHSSYYPWDEGQYKEIFALLHKLEVGDDYFITYKGKKYTYRVTEVFEIKPDDVSVLEQPVDKKISTLMTCTPIGTTLKRLIVRAELIQ